MSLYLIKQGYIDDGEAGKIQVSQTTVELLKNEFIMEQRGTIDVKGKGPMNTWFLMGSKEGSNRE